MCVVINITEDGNAHSLDAAAVNELGAVAAKTRVSTVAPTHPVKRAAFNVLRRVFGEDGKVAAWTRGWRGPWTATILHSGLSHTAQTRSECIAWEVSRVNQDELRRV